jgi:hypothetical protein
MQHAVAPGDRYYLVTAADPCTEGTGGYDFFLRERDTTRLDCVP